MLLNACEKQHIPAHTLTDARTHLETAGREISPLGLGKGLCRNSCDISSPGEEIFMVLLHVLFCFFEDNF